MNAPKLPMPAPPQVPVPASSINSAPQNKGVPMDAQPVHADEVDGVEPSNVEYVDANDSNERISTGNPKATLGRHVRSR
jgi:hypothetical protein